MTIGQRNRGMHRRQPAAEHVARDRRPRDARDREVEQARVRERVGECALHGWRGERQHAERRVHRLGIAVAAALGGHPPERLEPRDRVRFVARQLMEDERDPVAGGGVVRGSSDVRRDHHLQPPRRLAAALGGATQRAGAGGQDDVVRRDAETPPDRPDVVDRPRHPHVPSRAGPGNVERGAGGGRQQRVHRRAGERGQRPQPVRRRGDACRREYEPRAVDRAIDRAARQPRRG